MDKKKGNCMKNETSYRKQIISELANSLGAVEQGQINVLAAEFGKPNKIFCDGLGRSALVMQGFAMRLVQLGFSGSMVGEVTAPAVEKGDMLLICSASGASPVLLYHAQCVKERGGIVALITGNNHSLLAKLADYIVLIPAQDKDAAGGKERSIQPMGSLFEQTAQLLCDSMVLELMDRYGISSCDMRKRHANIE